jgi:hypothetical protein
MVVSAYFSFGLLKAFDTSGYVEGHFDSRCGVINDTNSRKNI